MSDRQIQSALPTIVTVPHCPSCTCAASLAPETTPQDLNLADDAIMRLTEEIKRNTETLYMLKRERNTRLPVSRIPPEILAEIFLAVRSVNTIPGEEVYCAKIGWVTVIHVSTHWRAVALSDPRLWNAPDLRFPNFVDNFLKYTGALPLRVVVSSPRSSDNMLHVSALRRVCEVANPITALELHGSDSDELSECLEWLLPECSGQLCSLELGVQVGDPVDRVPLHILWKHILPVLRTLSLEGIVLQWNCAMFHSCASSLRELTLRNCTFNTDLAALGALVHLEKLELYDIDYESGGMSQSIPLPALKRLYVNDVTICCLGMIKRLTLSPQCLMTIVDSSSDIDCILHVAHVKSLMKHVSSQSPLALEIQLGIRATKLWWTLANHVQHTLEVALSSEYDMAFCIAASGLSCNPERLSIFMLQNRNITADTLSTLCTPIGASVRALTVGGNDVFLDALVACLAHHDSFLPNLARLNIEGADFSKLSPGAVQQWQEGVHARQAVLERIDLGDCTGSPPALPNGQESVQGGQHEDPSTERVNSPITSA